MRRALLPPAIPAMLCACAALAGCGFGLGTPVRLVTNRAEMAAYVDKFNVSQSDVRVEISYQESPLQAVLDGVRGDIVMGDGLASPSVMDRLDSLSDIMKPGKLDPSWFYARLLAMGSRDNRPFLVPVAFSLPAIVYIASEIPDIPAMFMPVDTLRSMSLAFNRTNKAGDLVGVGFSPGLNGDFIIALAQLSGARFRPGRGGLPAWDENGLRKTVDFTREWLSEVSGGAAADAAFSRRNQVQPWYRLLSSRKIHFALTSFTTLFALPEDRRRDFDFRWLAQDGVIPILDDVLFAGVFRSSRNKAGSRAFLEWFCSPGGQVSLLNINQSERVGVFAVANGFSSLKNINEKELPQRYPLLLGHIPLESILSFPGALPDNWQKLRDEVVGRWIMAAAGNTENRPLDKPLQEWLDSQKK